MRCAILTLALVIGATLVACKDEPSVPSPPSPPHDGVTLIHRGAPPYQPLRYHLTRGTRTMSRLTCDLVVKNDGESGPMPMLVVDLDTSVEEILADGSAKLRITVAQTSVRDRPGGPVTSDMLAAQATAMQGVVIAETLAPDGQLVESHVEAAASIPDRAREQLDRLTKSLAQVATRLPAEPVGIGATWRERRTLPDGGIRAVSETFYTLTALTPASLAFTSVGLSSGEPQTVEQDGLKVEVTNTHGHSHAQGSVDLTRYAFDATSTSSFATAMNVVAPEGTPGAGPSTVEITMAIHVAPTGEPNSPVVPSAPYTPPSQPSAVITAGSTEPAPSDNAEPPSIGAPQRPAPAAAPPAAAPPEPSPSSAATASERTAAHAPRQPTSPPASAKPAQSSAASGGNSGTN